MKPKKKPSLSMILGMGSPDPAEESETDAGGKTEAMTQLFDAMKAGDAAAGASALAAFIDLHMSEEDEEEGDEESDDAHAEEGEL